MNGRRQAGWKLAFTCNYEIVSNTVLAATIKGWHNGPPNHSLVGAKVLVIFPTSFLADKIDGCFSLGRNRGDRGERKCCSSYPYFNSRKI